MVWCYGLRGGFTLAKGICGSPVGCLVPATGIAVLAGVTCGWHTAGFCRSLRAALTFLVMLDFNSFALALLVALCAAVFPSFPPKGGRGRGGESGREGHARDARCRTTEDIGNAVLALETWCKREKRLPKQRSSDPEERRLAVWIMNFHRGQPAAMTSAQEAVVEELLLRLNRRPDKLEVSGAIATTPSRVTRGGSAGTPTGSVRPGSSEFLCSLLESRNVTAPTLSRRESKKDGRAVLATCWQRARRAPCDFSCLARVWSGTQCRRRRAVRSDGTGGLGEFCALHQKNQSLYGRVDNSMPDADFEKLVRRAAACEQQSGFKWYSRLRMWDIASAKSVQSVDGLSNDDFLECLQAVNLYFQKHDVQRHAWGLSPHAGPQSVADRADLAKMDYVGDPRRFRFYAMTVFRGKLESLVAGSTELVNGRLHLTGRATERQFMVALDLTSRAMQDMHVVRSSGAVCHYRGPQCFTHRHDVERLGFEPLPVASPPGLAGRVTPPARRRMDLVMPMVQCDEPSCRKWRRIDGATRDLFHGEGWGSDRIHDARRELLEAHVWLESVCANWVQRRWPQADRSELFVADVAAYEAFVQSDARIVDCDRLHPASLLQLFVDACAGQNVPRAEDLDEARRCVWGSLQGVRFRCEMLVHTTCDDPCDWHMVTGVAHDFTDWQGMSHAPIFLHDADVDDSQEVRVVEFLRAEDQRGPVSRQTVLVRFPAEAGCPQMDVEYVRTASDPVLHRKVVRNRRDRRRAGGCSVPACVHLCGESHVPIRTAKIHTALRERVLRRMLDGCRVMSNMVLFSCKICKERFPTWHPKFPPDFSLDCLRHCSVAVAQFDAADRDPPVDARWAPLCRGICKRCADSEAKVEGDPLLEGIATFSAKNDWDPLFGMDDGAVRKEWLYLAGEATVVESMLVALSHMQVSVCYVRRMRGGPGRALPAFHKNIICFPQEVAELRNLRHYFSSLRENDVVNVRVPGEGNRAADAEGVLRRARVVGMAPKGVRVRVDGMESELEVDMKNVEQRVVLPWRPKDLSDHLIIFRRRHGRKEEYVDDLRVRRKLVSRILLLLTERGEFRAGRGAGTLVSLWSKLRNCWRWFPFEQCHTGSTVFCNRFSSGALQCT